ncbi:MAG: glycosyltransferase [Proteobacteria bacterium]|nr:glycosyltransferase [Pseudomonadota bacterium]
MSSAAPTLFEKLCQPLPDGTLPPVFHVPLQQYSMSGMEVDRDITEAEQDLWQRSTLLGYLMNKRTGNYFSDSSIPGLIPPLLMDWLNEKMAEAGGLPVTRFAQILCRHLAPYDRLYDLRKKRGVIGLYSDLAGALGLALRLPPELIPQAVFDVLAQPAESPAGDMPLSRGLAHVWRTLLPQLLFEPEKERNRAAFLMQFFQLSGGLGLDARFMTPAFVEWLNAPAHPTGREGVAVTHLMMEVFRMAGVEENRWNDPAYALHMAGQFFAEAYPNLMLPLAVAEAHERIAAAGNFPAVKKVFSPWASAARPRYVTKPVKPAPIDAAQAEVNVIGWDDQYQRLERSGQRLAEIVRATGLRHTRIPSSSEAGRMEKGAARALPRPFGPINVFACDLDHLGDYFLRQGLETFEGRYNIGLCAWETGKLPRTYKTGLHLLDEVWVASAFEKMLFEKDARCPVQVMPPALNAAPPLPAVTRAMMDLPQDAFLFMTAFDCLDWLSRKNPRAAVQAFKQAFTRNEKVALVIKTRNIARTVAKREEGHVFRLIKACADPRIHVIHDDLPDAEMNGLLNLCDAYVSLHRCSSFGALMAEAMALGKPVIATEGSGLQGPGAGPRARAGRQAGGRNALWP